MWWAVTTQATKRSCDYGSGDRRVPLYTVPLFVEHGRHFRRSIVFPTQAHAIATKNVNLEMWIYVETKYTTFSVKNTQHTYPSGLQRLVVAH